MLDRLNSFVCIPLHDLNEFCYIHGDIFFLYIP